ncbi:peptidase M19 [Rhodobacterales bacterium 52_120_T64]|nr:peptidase M19 [Rhodobacterales bacterium 52_120_T64]
MTSATFPPIFDGHNDVLLLQMQTGESGRKTFMDGNSAHIDVPKSRIGGFGGGFFAIYIPSPGDFSSFQEMMQQPAYDLPLPAPVPQAEAEPVMLAQAEILRQLEADGALKICTKTAEIRECLGTGLMAAIMHIEGAEGIDTNLDMLGKMHDLGLRSLGPVWSRPTAFGHGVPFRYPSDGDIGEGLTDAGKDLVRECNRLGIMLDLSHLNAAGMRDIAKISDAPLVATHSNCHAISPHARNLTDDQLMMIKDSNGMVGLNFASAFLRPDGQMKTDIGLDVMMRHLDHLITHLGEDRVGLGSDFDGAQIPDGIGDIAGLTNLREEMRRHGIDEPLMAKICNENWLSLLDRTWK